MRFYINSFRSSFKDIILSTKLQHCGQWLYTQSDRSVLSSEYLILEFEGNYQFLFYFLAAFFHKNLLVYIFCQYGGIRSNKLKRTQCWRSLSKSFYIVRESIVKNILSNILCPVSLVLGSQIPGPGSCVPCSGILGPRVWGPESLVLGPGSSFYTMPPQSCTWPHSDPFSWRNPCSGCNSGIDLVAALEYTFFAPCSNS